jgi:DNA polymerase elongation subunit (family B)
MPQSLSVQFDVLDICHCQSSKLLSCLTAALLQYDPDIILTSYGDVWLFSYLEKISKETGIPFNPNRDLTQIVHRKKEISFHNYGQAHYRSEQVHLFGRWHIDDQNCMTYADYGSQAH